MENEVPERKEEEKVQDTQAPVEEAAPAPEPAPEPAAAPQPAADVPHEERLWAMGCHLAALIGMTVPLATLLAPLVLWLVKRESSSYIDSQGKEAVNFQISILIYVLGAMLLMVIGIGFLLLPVVVIFDLIMIIVATIKANSGEEFRYPLCIRFIK